MTLVTPASVPAPTAAPICAAIYTFSAEKQWCPGQQSSLYEALQLSRTDGGGRKWKRLSAVPEYIFPVH